MPVTKHTPGPLIVQEDDFGPSEFVITTQQRKNKSQVPICKMDVDFDGQIGVEQQANALLIAAAPDLLKALQDMVDYYGTASASVEALHKAHAAIAKAEGGQPCQ